MKNIQVIDGAVNATYSIVTVAGHPNDDIPKGTLHSMFRQAGIKKR